jgi:ATP/maltotriose-dependent transcriptional regulator MalT
MSQAAVPISRTKIIVPAPRPEILHRQRLLALLDDLLEKKLVLISAPAGYGKTSLLVDMATSGPMPFCWFSVDALDQDPQRFLHYLIAAITQRFPKFGSRSRSALNSLTSLELGLENLMVNLVNEIYERIDEHFVLVIDDYQFVDSVVDIRNFISRFVRVVSENCHVVLSSRRLPALPDMTLLVAGDQVGGFSMEELAFNPEEIHLLYQDVYKTELNSEGLEQVVRQTEGWITGLQLTRPTPSGSLPDLSRSVRITGVDLAHYFDEQVLSQQEPEIREFLLQSSFLDEFDAGFCQTVLGSIHPGGRHDWKQLVETVRRGNLFTQSVGPKGKWLRYHHLFQEFLKEKLLDEQPELARQIIYQLASVCQERRDWERTFRIYKQQSDVQGMISLVETAGSEMVSHNRIITVGEWLNELPEQAVRERPILSSLRGRIHMAKGEIEDSIRCYNRAIQGLSETDAGYPLALTLVRRSNALRMLGRYAESVQDADRALEISKTDKKFADLIAAALQMKGESLFRQGHLQEAVAITEEALQTYQRIQDEKGVGTVQATLGMIYRALGDLGQAGRLYHQALEFLRLEGDIASQSGLLNNLSVLYHQQGEYELALRHLDESLELSRQTGDARMQALIHASQGDIYEELEDFELADQAHSYTESYARQANVRFLFHYSMIARARIARRMSNLRRAAAFLEEIRTSIEQSNSNYDMGLYRLEWGCIQLQTGNIQTAQESLVQAADTFRHGGLKLETGLSLLWLVAARRQAAAAGKTSRETKELVRLLGEKQYFHPLSMTIHQVINWLDEEGLETELRKQFAPSLAYAVQTRKRFPALCRWARRMTGNTAALFLKKLTILTLGKPQVLINDKAITVAQWKSSAARELFFYLLAASRPLSKEEIGAILWPDASAEQLRLRFKNNIYRLRNATDQNVIVYENNLYSFNREFNYSLDLETYTSALQKAKQSTELSQQIQHYRTAIGLVRGRYLEGIYSTWVLPERERLEQEYLDALLALARLLVKAGNPFQAIQICQKAVAWDGCFEDAHRLLMEIYAATGDRDALRRQHQSLKKILKNSLGSVPSAETEKLFRSLIR